MTTGTQPTIPDVPDFNPGWSWYIKFQRYVRTKSEIDGLDTQAHAAKANLEIQQFHNAPVQATIIWKTKRRRSISMLEVIVTGAILLMALLCIGFVLLIMA